MLPEQGKAVVPMLHLAQRLFDTPLAIHRAKYEVIVQAIGPRLLPEIDLSSFTSLSELRAFQDSGRSASDEFLEGAQHTEEGYLLTQDGIAVVPVRGTLVKKSSFADATSGLCSYQRIGQMFSAAMKCPDVRGILLDVNSPGGETHGMFDLADTIASAREKPVYAIANDAALSAAYLLASAADRIFLTRTGAVGSVGVFSCHIDQSGADEKAGLKFTYIFSGDKKINGNPHAPLSREARQDAQDETDRQYQMFVDAVSKNRGATTRSIAGTEAAVFTADTAIPLLADAVGNVEDAYNALVKKTDATQGLRPMVTVSGTRTYTVSGLTETVTTGAVAAAPKEATVMPVIPYTKTATVRQTWSASANRKNLRAKASQSYYERGHAYRDSDLDPNTKNAYTFIHHEVSGNGNIGAANLTACSSGIAVLNGGRGGQGRETYTPTERRGIYRHLSQHQKDAGEDPSPLQSYREYIDARLALGLIGPALAAGLHQYLSANPAAELLAEYAFVEGDDPMSKTLTPEEELLSRLAHAAATESESDPPEDDEDDDAPDKDRKRGKKGKKGSNQYVRKAGLAAAPKDKDPDDDEDDDEEDNGDDDDDAPDKKDARAETILNLCSLASQAGHLSNPLPTALRFLKKGYTVAQVINKLAEQRATRSSETQTEGYGVVRTSALEQFITGPRQLARAKGISLGAATELILQQNPQAYEQYIQEKADATGQNPFSSTAKAYAESVKRMLSQTGGGRKEILLTSNVGDAAFRSSPGGQGA